MSADPKDDCFLDTNILVYAFDRSAGHKHIRAAQLVEALWEKGNGCLSIQVLQEFYVTVTRKIRSPLDYPTARQIVSDLAHWRTQEPDVNDLLQAIDFQINFQLSFWDAMIVQSAARLGCKQILSEDFGHGQKLGEVVIVNPFMEIG